MKRQLLSLILVTTLLITLLDIGPSPVRAASFVVNTDVDDADAHDVNPGDGVCADTYNVCPLRAAIEETNALAGADTITFNEAMTITLDPAVGALPQIWQQLTIDASSVWDTNNNRPGVTLDGSGLNVAGIELRADQCKVYGLFITNFYTAIDIYGADFTIIGGKDPGQRNVLSGNRDMGIRVSDGGTGNQIYGNWIGLSVTGTTKAPNFHGIYITGGANNNYIGGPQTGEGNYISGNTFHGVYIQGENTNHNNLYGNTIGLPVTGSQNVGNGGNGVYIQKLSGDTRGPQYTQIGREASGEGNTIANNGAYGVYIDGANANYVENCAITANALDGVRIDGATATGNLIQANSIHDNGGKGIALVNSAQNNVAAPTITSASASGASGTGCNACRIDIYSDHSDEGAVWHGYVTANASGDWTYSGTIVGPYVTAAATTNDAYEETSEFSAPKRTVYIVYLPLAMKNN